MKIKSAIILATISIICIAIMRTAFADGPVAGSGSTVHYYESVFCIGEPITTLILPMASSTGSSTDLPDDGSYVYVEVVGDALSSNYSYVDPYNLLDFWYAGPTWAPFVYDWVRDDNTAGWGSYGGAYPAYHIWIVAAPDKNPFGDWDDVRWRYRDYSTYLSGQLTVYLYKATPGECPLPATATPASPLATNAPTTTPLCITPTPRATRTPLPTLTPFGGFSPTATISATTVVTPTSAQSLSVGPAKFPSSLSPWNRVAGFFAPYSQTTWISHNGADGAAGVAFVGYFPEPGDVITGSYMAMPALAYIRATTYPVPALIPGNALRLSGLARSDPVSTSWRADLQIWILDLDYGGSHQAAWVKKATIPATAAWRQFDQTITWSSGRHIGGVAITARYAYAPVGPPPSAPVPGGGIAVDDLLLAAGDAASSLAWAGAGLPVCPGYNAGVNSWSPPAVRLCYISSVPVDVIGPRCPAPSSALDIGGWLSNIACKISAYFDFNATNRRQLQEMMFRNERSEPFGTITELDDVNNLSTQFLADLQTNAGSAVDFDWALYFTDRIMSGDIFSNILAGDFAQQIQFDAGAYCASIMPNWNLNSSPLLCPFIYFSRTTPLGALFQISLSVGSLLMLGRYAYGKWQRLAS